MDINEIINNSFNFQQNILQLKFLVLTAHHATTNNANNFFPDIFIAIDHDDANTPASIEVMQEYGRKLPSMGTFRPDKWSHFSLWCFYFAIK